MCARKSTFFPKNLKTEGFSIYDIRAACGNFSLPNPLPLKGRLTRFHSNSPTPEGERVARSGSTGLGIVGHIVAITFDEKQLEQTLILPF